MNLHTKNTIALSLLGTTIALSLIGYEYGQQGTYAELGTSAMWSASVLGGLTIFTFFNWFIIRALTGIRIFSPLSRKDEGQKSVRNFSWLLLLVSSPLLAGPMIIVATQSSFVVLITGASAFTFLICFMLFVPPSDGTRALNQFKSLTDTEKK